MAPSLIRRVLLNTISHPTLLRPLRFLLNDKAIIFCLHRIAVPELRIVGHERAVLRKFLALLRRERYPIRSLQSVFKDLQEGRPLQRAVVFTLDDGYAEQVSVAAPLFAEFDVPSTLFLTTGFIDRHVWMWWDQVEYIFAHTKRAQPEPLHAFLARCKNLPNEARVHAIERLAHTAEISLPRDAPAAYAPTTWQAARDALKLGMSFGAHTVNHPILSRVSDAVSRDEIATSFTRLRDERLRPVSVFCYPNGYPADFSEREVIYLRELGCSGAVKCQPGYARSDDRFRVNRFALPETLDAAIRIVSGLPLVRQAMHLQPAGVKL